MNPIRTTVMTALVLFLSGPAGAAVETPSGSRFVLNSLIALSVVIALAVIGLRVLKKLGNFQESRQGRLRITDSISLSNNERLLLIRVDGREVLIGTAPGRISTLLTLDGDSPAADRGVIPQPEAEPGFGAILRRNTAHLSPTPTGPRGENFRD